MPSKKQREPDEGYPTDEEIRALARVAAALKDLDRSKVERILRYAADRCGVSIEREVIRYRERFGYPYPTPPIIIERTRPYWDLFTSTWYSNAPQTFDLDASSGDSGDSLQLTG